MIKKTIFLAVLAGCSAVSAQTLSLSASAEKEVTRDEMVMRLFVEKKGKNLEELNKSVLADLNKALRTSRAGAQVASAGLNTYPVYDKNGRTDQWNVRANVEVRGLDKQAVSATGEALGQFMGFESLQFEVSRAAVEKARNELVAEVAKSFRERAQLTANALGYKAYEIGEVALDVSLPQSNRPVPQPRVMAMRAASLDMAVESAGALTEGGKEKVSTTLQGSVHLKN